MRLESPRFNDLQPGQKGVMSTLLSARSKGSPRYIPDLDTVSKPASKAYSAQEAAPVVPSPPSLSADAEHWHAAEFLKLQSERLAFKAEQDIVHAANAAKAELRDFAAQQQHSRAFQAVGPHMPSQPQQPMPFNISMPSQYSLPMQMYFPPSFGGGYGPPYGMNMLRGAAPHDSVEELNDPSSGGHSQPFSR